MSTEIILIGPMNTGKSTVGKLLSEFLGIPSCSLDSVRYAYYEEIGYSRERQRQISETEGGEGVYRYWKPFEAHAVERVLSDKQNCVIDFGAGHSVYEDEALFARVQKALAPFPNVVLLLPSPNLEESARILQTRKNGIDEEMHRLNLHFLTHHSNHDLAKFVVYTQGKTPEQTRDEILGITGLKP